jgi:predicted ATPase/DNA-binding SARP family transcriptional activator
MSVMPGAEARVLGPVEIANDEGATVPLPAKQTRLLAALLVAEGRAWEPDELVEAVWSGSPPASARNLVQVYVSQLRKALPAGIEVVTRGHAYAVELDDELLDAKRFERLLDESAAARRDGNAALAASLAEQALALWRGRAYGELAYDDFARTESDRLQELRLVALEERLNAQLALGRHQEVVGEALALATKHPHRERVHELVMLALYRCGRQTEALEHYAAFRASVSEELGLEPGPALNDLQRRILQQDPDLALAADPGELVAALPVPPNPLVGRRRELDELAALLARRDARLIVLTGAGGSGKTRLALEAVRRAAGSYANGAALVDLAPLRDHALVLPTIAHALGIAEASDLEAALAPQERLLLVDNAEHLREAAPHFGRLVAQAPRLTILVTSRAVLHVSGEHVFEVLPLAEEDAVELFVQRARLLEPTFARSDENEPDLREICRRVDGLPLAVELAAARIRTLPPHRLRERLDERLALLTGGPRDLPARQQTLRETVKWSVSLLGAREREAFMRLAVFPAGATLEAAEDVCGADLDALGVLVDDHLVQRGDAQEEPRFGMLETVREYALELLGDERASVELALAEHFAERADDLVRSGPVERDWRTAVERLDPDVDNIRVALAAAARSEDRELQLRLAGGLWRYWWVRGSPGEGLDWIERALAVAEGPPTEARATALYGAAGLAWTRGDLERAQTLAEAAIPVAVDTGSTWTELSAHTVLGVVANNQGDHERARRHHRRSIELKEQLGIEPAVERLNLAVVELDAGNNEEAIELFDEVLAWHRQNENPGGIGFALLNRGLAHVNLGAFQAAERDFEEGRACFEQVGFRQQVAHGLQGLAICAAGESRFEEAARLLEQARRELYDIGAVWDLFAQDQLAEAEAQVRAALGHERYEALSAGMTSEP